MKMKYIFLFIAIVLVPLFGVAQSKSYKMYDVFTDREGVTNFSFSKNMIDAIDLSIGDEDEDGEKNVTGDLNQVRFMSYNPNKGKLSGPEFLEKAIGFLPKSSYHKYKDPDGDNDAEIWLLGKKKKYSECHVFFKNDNAESLHFIVSFYGDFKVSDMEGMKELGRGFSD